MRRRALTAAALTGLLLQGLPGLAGRAPAAGLGPERASLAGRVVDGSSGRGIGHATVRLVGADPAHSRRVTRTAESNGGGHFRFSRLPAGPDRNYVLAAKRAGGYFPARSVVLEPGTTARRVVRTWPTTTQADVIEVGSDRLFLVPSRKGVSVVESVTFDNSAHAAYIGPRSAMGQGAGGPGGRQPTSLVLTVPATAARGSVSIVHTDLPLARLQPATFGLGLVNAIPPGAHRILYSYNVTGGGGTFELARPVLYPVDRLTVFAAEPLTVDGSGLSFVGRSTIRGQTFGRWANTEGYRPLDEMSIVAAAQTSPAPGLLAGAGLLLVTGVAGWVIVRRRRRSPADAARPAPLPRERIVGAIAELDLRHEAGQIDDEQWAERRRRLKERIAGGREPAA